MPPPQSSSTLIEMMSGSAALLRPLATLSALLYWFYRLYSTGSISSILPVLSALFYSISRLQPFFRPRRRRTKVSSLYITTELTVEHIPDLEPDVPLTAGSVVTEHGAGEPASSCFEKATLWLAVEIHASSESAVKWWTDQLKAASLYTERSSLWRKLKHDMDFTDW